MQMAMRVSRRTATASEAVVERIVGQYLRPGVVNLAPGVAHWTPPMGKVLRPEMLLESTSSYGDCRGEPGLVDALKARLESENGENMSERDVMVTNGANQAFVQAMLCLCDEGDECVLFRPYYFSHLVALQLCGVRPVIVDCDPITGQPDADGLRAVLQRDESRVRAAVLVSPSNPSGAVCSVQLAEELQTQCAAASAWLVVDSAYEHFTFGGSSASRDTRGDARSDGECTEGLRDRTLSRPDNLVVMRTMSKSYGLAGWRVGYMSYPSHIHEDLLKVQDTLPTHACRASQQLALHALTHLGTPWVCERVRSLELARSALWEALAPLRHVRAAERPGGLLPRQPAGAFYYWIPLPEGAADDETVIRWLAEEHSLLLLPGFAFGAPGHLRLSYGGLGQPEAVEPVALALSAAAEQLARGCGPTGTMVR